MVASIELDDVWSPTEPSGYEHLFQMAAGLLFERERAQLATLFAEGFI